MKRNPIQLSLVSLTILAGLALGFFTTSLHAAPVLVTTIANVSNRTLFDAAVSVNATDDFESPAVPPHAHIQLAAPLSTPVGTFSLNGDNPFYLNASNTDLGAGDGSQFINWNGTSSPYYTATLTLNSGEIGAGSDVFDTFSGPSTQNVVVTEKDLLGNLYYQNFSFQEPAATGSPSTLFEGFIATPGMTLVSVEYTASGQYTALDNYSVGTTPAVPEPSTCILLGLGLTALMVTSRRYSFKLL